MPFVVHPRVRKRLARVTAMTAACMFATTGMAMACAKPAVTQPFAQFSDTSSYFPLPGGNFESPRLPGWHLADAALTPGNEPFYVGQPTDSQSLTIQGGGTVISAPFCVDSTMPSFRFFAHQIAGGSDLKVELISLTRHFTLTDSQVADLADGSMSQWAPVKGMGLASVLNLPVGASYPVVIKITAPGSGAWQIDDVYVDPWSFG